jgi:acyl carrier protein|tara:strand:+ start:132 stop:353 length:222 start_codon:yes stop_codon:yes gene_type:complete
MNENKFLDIIKKALNEKQQNLTLNTKLIDIKKWDSLANVRVLLNLNKKSLKKLKISEIVNFKNLKDLFKYYSK